ncbi:MAG: hypothetical protein ACERKN_17110 [Velocimicrobium sp.]
MRIKSSNVVMASQRTYMARSADLFSYASWGSEAADDSTLPTAKDSVQQTATGRIATSFQSFSQNEVLTNLEWEQRTIENKVKASSKFADVYEAKNPIEFYTFRNLLELLFGVGTIKRDWVAAFRQVLSKRGEVSDQFFGMPLQMNEITPSQNWGVSYQETHYFEEQESTNFYSSGKVKTEDGREIEFDVSACMTRNFKQYSNVEINYGKASYVDPLVINMGSDTADVREQKFLFDLDCDGTLDNISILSQMSGYLALDKNGDGVINDGSELFGTKTGDGFGELAVFDMDGNGWIDENDPIFNSLRIWTKDTQGKDKLIGLGVQGIGAIYLGNIETEYAINAAATNETNAKIRSTGVYLKENGEAGTIQHIDASVRV